MATNGHRTVESASRSASPLPPPLPSRSLASNVEANASRSYHDQSEGPSSSAKRVKPEPYSSPSRLRDMEAVTDTVIPEDTHNELPLQQQDDEEMYEDAPAAAMSPADRGASPPPPADAESQQSSASEFFVAPAAPVAEQRQFTPSVEVQKAPPKAEAPSPQIPHAAQRLASKLQSPMASQSQALSQSQSQSQSQMCTWTSKSDAVMSANTCCTCIFC